MLNDSKQIIPTTDWMLSRLCVLCTLTRSNLGLITAGPVVTEEKIQEAKLFYQMHFKQAVFDEEGWRKVLEVYKEIFNSLPGDRFTYTEMFILIDDVTKGKCARYFVRNTMAVFQSGSKLSQRAG